MLRVEKATNHLSLYIPALSSCLHGEWTKIVAASAAYRSDFLKVVGDEAERNRPKLERTKGKDQGIFKCRMRN